MSVLRSRVPEPRDGEEQLSQGAWARAGGVAEPAGGVAEPPQDAGTHAMEMKVGSLVL